MNKISHGLTLVNQQIEAFKTLGILQLSTEDERLKGRTFKAKGKELINFGSCSYMGLETDERLKAAAIEAVEKFGAQYSSSRSYVSLGLYNELESTFEKLFDKPTILAPSTSMGHFSAIPAIVSERDAVILDQQVHASVRTGVKLVQATGTYVEKIIHNDMARLEKRIVELGKEYEAVWYMADGIYSMYGDVAPIKELEALLNKYEHFHLYIDDAHGVGWFGENGKGFVLENMEFHDRMVLTASAAKSFGACGGLIVFPNQEVKDLVRNVGGTLMFSGPLQPATLAALLRSVQLHFTEEIKGMQNELSENISHFVTIATELGLPVASNAHTPVFFIGAGTLQTGALLCRKMIDQGFYTNFAGFPAVAQANTGLRITITRHQKKEDITRLLETFEVELVKTLKENNYPIKKVFEAFDLPIPKRRVA